MTQPISTRRAIEVCLSRLRLNREAARDLALHLAAVIRDGEPPAPDDPDGLRAAILVAEEELTGIDTSFPKAAVIGRLHEARLKLQWARGGRKAVVEE